MLNYTKAGSTRRKLCAPGAKCAAYYCHVPVARRHAADAVGAVVCNAEKSNLRYDDDLPRDGLRQRRPAGHICECEYDVCRRCSAFASERQSPPLPLPPFQPSPAVQRRLPIRMYSVHAVPKMTHFVSSIEPVSRSIEPIRMLGRRLQQLDRYGPSTSRRRSRCRRISPRPSAL